MNERRSPNYERRSPIGAQPLENKPGAKSSRVKADKRKKGRPSDLPAKDRKPKKDKR